MGRVSYILGSCTLGVLNLQLQLVLSFHHVDAEGGTQVIRQLGSQGTNLRQTYLLFLPTLPLAKEINS